MVTQSPPASEVSMVESWQFTVLNLDQHYVLVSYAHKTTRRDMTRTMLKMLLKTKTFTRTVIFGKPIPFVVWVFL